MTGLIELSWVDVLVAIGLLILTAGVSVALRLGLERELLLGGLRAIAQLAVVGLLLTWLFAWDAPVLVLVALVLLLLGAGGLAFRRVAADVPGSFRLVLGALAAGSLLTLLVVAYLAVGVEPWYSPRYLVPLYALVLGHGLTGIALGLSRLVSEVRRRRDEIELLLSLGANSWQALAEPLRAAMRAALAPTFQSLLAVGVVVLPSLMTGQILAGASPTQALRYQLLVIFAGVFAAAVSTLAALVVVHRRFFTAGLQLRDGAR